MRKVYISAWILSIGIAVFAAGQIAVSASESANIDYTDGNPWLDSNINGVVTEDMETNLKDDFYLAMNKDEILNMQYQSGEQIVENLGASQFTVRDNKLALLQNENPQTHDEEMLRSFYLALDDWDTRNAMIKERIPERLEKIDSLQSMKDYCEATYDWKEDNALLGLLQIDTSTPSDDSSILCGYLDRNNLLLEDAAEYVQRSVSGNINYEVYKERYCYALELIGEDTSSAEQDFDAMIAFEAEIAEHSMTVEEISSSEAVVLRDNYFSVDEIDEMLGDNYDFQKMLEMNSFLPKHAVMVPEPEAITFIGSVLDDDSYLEKIKNWEKVRFMLEVSLTYSKDAMEHTYEIIAQHRGAQEIYPYEEQLLATVDQKLSNIMQKAYVERYADEAMKTRIREICEEIAEEYCQMLSETDWLEDETREAAIKKLKSIKINSVYPDKWDDDTPIDVTGLNYYEAMHAIQIYRAEELLTQLDQEIDPEIWLMDCTVPNAMYMSYDNSINIYLGILGEETYTNDMKTEEMYGRIGMVIAHEISHAFDSAGSQYDENGNLRCWWTEGDKQKFDEKVEKIRAYFNKISIYGDNMLVGAMLDCEASADITSVECLLRMAKKIPDFDYNLFFSSMADLWAMKADPYIIDYYYAFDTHPANYLRVNVTLQQFDEFLDLYEITEDDKMYLAPEDRLIIW